MSVTVFCAALLVDTDAPSHVRCVLAVVQPMPVLPEPVDPQQEQQLQQELADLREELTQVGARRC
jgi:hypothetical protein